MQGVFAPSGQTSPLSSRVKVWSETPYWTYSMLVGGGSTAVVCACAGGAPSMRMTAQLSANATAEADFRGESVRALGICFSTGLTNAKPFV
jgi:hypothetical protein